MRAATERKSCHRCGSAIAEPVNSRTLDRQLRSCLVNPPLDVRKPVSCGLLALVLIEAEPNDMSLHLHSGSDPCNEPNVVARRYPDFVDGVRLLIAVHASPHFECDHNQVRSSAAYQWSNRRAAPEVAEEPCLWFPAACASIEMVIIALLT